MGGYFSTCEKKTKKPPGGTISDTDRAVLDLKNARDRLTRYRSKLDKDEKKLLVRAKDVNAEGHKSMAVGLLRLRKHKLNEASNVDQQLLTVLEMVDTINSKENEKDLVVALKAGKDALQDLHNEMSIDEILNLMDDVQEQTEVEGQINDILKHGVPLNAEDEDEVTAELEALEKEVKGETITDEKVEPVELPEVPTSKLPEVQVPAEAKAEASKRPERVAVAS